MNRRSFYSSFLAFLKSQIPVFRERQFLWGLHLLTRSRKSQGPDFEELAVRFNMMLQGESAMRLERCLFLSLVFSGLQSWLVQPCMCFRMCERYRWLKAWQGNMVHLFTFSPPYFLFSVLFSHIFSFSWPLLLPLTATFQKAWPVWIVILVLRRDS